MGALFNFGEKVDEYDYKVINEREARSSAGIMFLFGIISLFSFILTKNLFYAEVFTITFILEFLIRIIINPLYAPYMILGSLFVSNQKPEWVEAKPKQFAWILGMILGLIMTYFILYDIVTPLRISICILCLVLLFTESAFGICLGCMVYNKFNVKTQNCPGGVCESNWTKPKRLNKFVGILFIIVLFVTTYNVMKNIRYADGIDNKYSKAIADDKAFKDVPNTKAKSDCNPPQWAIDMGHKELWKEHNCK